MNRLHTTILALGVFAATAPAFAASGTITGTIQFSSELGNTCDTSLGMDCTDAVFPASASNSVQPVRDAAIALADETGAVVGAGVTDSSGNFSIGWNRATTPTSIQIRRFFTHKDDRFWHSNTSNASLYGVVTTVNSPTNGGTNNVGTWGWYSYEVLNNNFDAALRTWDMALQYSGDMASRFTTIQIILPATDPNNAFADGAVVHMGQNLVRRPQSALSHEFGHVATYLQRPYKFCGAYNYPTGCLNVDPGMSCTGGHTFNSSEHFCASYEEGMAQFIANAAYYWYNADNPVQCISDSECTTGFNFETSSGSGCTAGTQHMEVEVTRYLWDAYDAIDDAGFTEAVPSSNQAFRYGAMIDTIENFTVGQGNNQNNEPWNSGETQIDAADGRSAGDYKVYIDAIESTTDQFTNNCSPG
jgi:hypothetical protein